MKGCVALHVQTHATGESPVEPSLSEDAALKRKKREYLEQAENKSLGKEAALAHRGRFCFGRAMCNIPDASLRRSNVVMFSLGKEFLAVTHVGIVLFLDSKPGSLFLHRKGKPAQFRGKDPSKWPIILNSPCAWRGPSMKPIRRRRSLQLSTFWSPPPQRCSHCSGLET